MFGIEGIPVWRESDFVRSLALYIYHNWIKLFFVFNKQFNKVFGFMKSFPLSQYVYLIKTPVYNQSISLIQYSIAHRL